MHHWDDLKYVLALEQNGNLVKAAKLLKTNPTTVSRHIKRLSEAYETTLFTRSNNGEWTATDAGREFAEVARRCQYEIDGLANTIEEKGQREIKISTTEFVADCMLAPNFHTLKELDENLSVSVETRDRNVSLAYGEADLALRLGRPKSGRLVVSKLGYIAMGVFSKDGNPRDQDWIGLPTEYDWVPEMQMGLEYFSKPPAFRIGSFASIRSMAVNLDMACIGPVQMMRDWEGLEQATQTNAFSERELWSVYHESRRLDQALSTVRSWVRSCLENEDRHAFSPRPGRQDYECAAQ